MRLCIIIVILSAITLQVRAACPEDILKLFTHDVVNSELNMNITTNNIGEEINKTGDKIEDVIKRTKVEIQSERDKLSNKEVEAYGKSLIEKRSIADCLQDNRVQMTLINSTESIIYSVCRADFSLFLVKLYAYSVNVLSKKLEQNLEVCIENYNCDCEKEKSCIMENLSVVEDEVNGIKSEVGKKLEKIIQTSEICADGKKSMVISMIQEQESKFEYCINQILNNA